MTGKLLRHIIELVALALAATSCHPIEEFDRDNRGEFEALWTAFDNHYCFFAEKDVDWNDVHDRYAPMVSEKLSRTQLFAVCAAMLDELKDGHVNLSSGFETSYYRNWWSDYPQNFNLRTVQQHYLNFEYKQLGNVIYGILPQNVGYIHIPSFSTGLSDSNIDWILADLLACNGLVLDLRDNGGGSMNFVENWVRHFITSTHTVGYMSHKTGPAHDDFSDPHPIRFEPLGPTGLVWVKPVVLLTNRSTFSAANYMVMCMRRLPNVTHAGATTGGGSGMPLSLELPGGWGVRMSAVRVYDADMRLTEAGIAPDEGCEIENRTEEIDEILDFAVNLLK